MYEQVLGVSPGASDEDIKKAYKRLAMVHHPDRGGDAEQFKKVSEAYEFLSDPAKRRPPGFDADPPKTYQFGIRVSLDEAWLGTTKTFKITRMVSCRTCNGHGVFKREFRMGPFVQQIHHPCPRCQGRGDLGKMEEVRESRRFQRRATGGRFSLERAPPARKRADKQLTCRSPSC